MAVNEIAMFDVRSDNEDRIRSMLRRMRRTREIAQRNKLISQNSGRFMVQERAVLRQLVAAGPSGKLTVDLDLVGANAKIGSAAALTRALRGLEAIGLIEIAAHQPRGRHLRLTVRFDKLDHLSRLDGREA